MKPDSFYCVPSYDLQKNLSEMHSLREQVERYRTLFANMSEGFALGEVICDAQGTAVDFCFSEVNDAFLRQTRLSRDILHRPAREWWPHLEQSWIERYIKVAMTGQADRFEDDHQDTGHHYEVYCFSPGRGRFAILFRDITDRKQMEEALRESESYFRQVIIGLPGMVWTTTADGQTNFVSPQRVAFTGLSYASQLGVGWVEAIHPQDRAAAYTMWCNAVERGSEYHQEYRLRHHDGTYRWVKSLATPIRDTDGHVTHWFGICTDIDDLRRVQDALKESERRYSALFANKTHAIAHCRVTTDESGHPVDYYVEAVNESYERIFGVRQEEMTGHHVTDAFSGIEHIEFDFIATFGKVALEGGEASFEVDLSRIGLCLSIYAYSATAGECTVIFTDVTAQKRAEAALRESEERYHIAFDQAPVGITHVNPDGYFMHVNRKFCDMLGYTKEELVQKRFVDVAYPADRGVGVAEFQRSLAGDLNTFVIEKRYLHRSGTVVWVRITASSVCDAGSNTACYSMMIIEDITERKQTEFARLEAERRLQLAVSIANLGFWEWNAVSNETYLSPYWKKHLGYDDHELPNRYEEWVSRLHPDERDAVLDYLHTFVKQRSSEYRSEYRLRHRNGSYRWVVVQAVATRDESGHAIKLIGTQLDVTERKLAEQRVREAAQHDPLTGLPNRALVFEYAGRLLAAATRSNSRGAFLFIDLDRFKPVNDLYGHEIGDRLLQEVAKRLTATVRQEDVVGRLGGDEFVIMLPQVSDNLCAATVAQHVLEALSRPFEIGTLDLSISASIGISHFPQHGMDVDTLIHAADLAMYQTKQGGRGNYQTYSIELNSRADASASIEAKLKRALQRDGLALQYQPVIDMRSGHLIGAEALLRLHSEDGQTVSPEHFIPVAESAGLISQLGEWVATEACRQHEEWRRQGLPPVTIAINVSPLQFRQRGFAQRLQGIVQNSSTDPAYLQIEVTESAVMESVEDAIQTLNGIRSAGIRIALDDFGTGYSSLSHLSSLPLDKLKVDQSFVKRLEHDRTSRAITGAIIALARTLNLEVVGEGIESEDALAYLQEHGCDQAQGFFISQPLPPAEFANWYRGKYLQ